jgi:hypothetical protein
MIFSQHGSCRPWATANGREPGSVKGSFTASQAGRRLCGNEISKATGSSRPTPVAQNFKFASTKQTFELR